MPLPLELLADRCPTRSALGDPEEAFGVFRSGRVLLTALALDYFPIAFRMRLDLSSLPS